MNIQNNRKDIVVIGTSLKDGKISLSGYKHAMVQVISSAVATNTKVLLRNVPLVDDTFVLMEIINKCGGKVSLSGNQLFVDPTTLSCSTIDQDLSKRIHGSIYLMPAFAVRRKEFTYFESGGCQIGSKEENSCRPISHMLEVMENFGISIENDAYPIKGCVRENRENIFIDIKKYSSSQKEMTGSLISGATKTAILCSPLARKTTIINPYLKTDVMDLLRFIKLMNYDINIKNNILEITPPIVKDQRDLSLCFQLTECVSEVITYIALAVLANIKLELTACNINGIQCGLKNELKLLTAMNINVLFNDNTITVYPTNKICSTDINVTNNSIQSDHHPFFTLMLLKANKPSWIKEQVWKDRFEYAIQLRKLGADLEIKDNTVFITPSKLSSSGEGLVATDTRAAAILLLASISLPGTTTIKNVHHLFRGYEKLIPSLESLGAKVKFA